MLSPARKHFLRVSAEQLAQQDAPTRLNVGIEVLMLHKLAQDKRDLSRFQSVERKIALKRKLLPDYDDYIAGVIAKGIGRQDDVLATVLIWQIDTENYEQALQIAAYALAHKMSVPGIERPLSTIICDEVGKTAAQRRELGGPLPLDVLQRFYDLLANKDIPDDSHARLLKALGLGFEDDGQLDKAEIALKRALALDSRCYTKKDLSRIAKKQQSK